MHKIIHFDISADDVSRAKDFYHNLFGWKIERFPGPMEYYLVDTTDENGEKGLTGGIAKREKSYQKITNFIQVSSIDEYMEKVKKLGGEVVEPKNADPNCRLHCRLQGY